MADAQALVRATGASQRQLEQWRWNGYLHATIEHGRAEYPDTEIPVARALAKMSNLGVMPSGLLAQAVCVGVRQGSEQRVHYGAITVDLRKLAKP